ncbi:hypothetical protein LMF32_10850 [Desemzia sp. C1]|uniref:hypothetical protein n=1 Tax=Desemzia TaxID=82800 RepID=UPI001E42CA78|nr:hypothetical protein [Desemzia sp. C1]MCI3029539.1 hypothetical protein [Desemzia sp. C1]
MEKELIEVSIVYKDNFRETYKINCDEFNIADRQVRNENLTEFHVGEKVFVKEEIALVATDNCTIQFY